MMNRVKQPLTHRFNQRRPLPSGEGQGQINESGSAGGLPWGLYRLNLQACWQQGYTGNGVRVGHLDTGVDASHPALTDRVFEFMEFDQEGYFVPGTYPWDSGSHGTHIAGIICGNSIGVAPDAMLCSGMVIEGGKCLVRILAGLDWMLDCKVRVLCLSLGIQGDNPLFEIMLSRLKRSGVLVIAPIGNRGSERSCSPANYPGVLAVGAINARDRIPRFSGSHLYKRAVDFFKPNLVAPGVDIVSAAPGGGMQTLSGTSMAAAHVVGVAALLFQAKPEATAEQVQEAILSTCTPLPASDERRCGRGIINPLKALEAITSGRRSQTIW